MSKEQSKAQQVVRASDNIASMYRSTAISLIFTELTGVIAVLIDGIVTSRFLGSDAYSGISLLGPFTSIVLLVAGIFSTGCSIVCSQFVGQGKKEEANEAFNLSSLLTVLLSIVIILACIVVPSLVLQLCGVPLNKYPELNPHMYGYLDGYKIGLPAFMLVAHFVRPNHYFRYSLGHLSLRHFGAVFANGTPALVKKLALTAGRVLTNYFNIMVALTTVAIAARGIQSDFLEIFFCIICRVLAKPGLPTQ